LDLEEVYCDVMSMGDYEPKEASDDDEKYTLEGVQEYILLVTLLENDVEVV